MICILNLFMRYTAAENKRNCCTEIVFIFAALAEFGDAKSDPETPNGSEARSDTYVYSDKICR